MAQINKNLQQLFFNQNEYFLFVDFEYYKKWWILISILIFFKKGYRNCLFFRKEYKFYKNIAVVGIKKNDRKVRRRTKGYSKKFLQKHSDTNCIYCKTKLNPENSSVDHIIPISKGGNNSQLNLVVVCRECNNERGDLEFKTYLKIKNEEFKKIEFPFI